MARICKITARRPISGRNVSHANNKSKRRFDINLKTKKFWLESEKRFVKLNVSTKGMRIIDKLGLEKALEMMKKTKQGN